MWFLRHALNDLKIQRIFQVVSSIFETSTSYVFSTFVLSKPLLVTHSIYLHTHRTPPLQHSYRLRIPAPLQPKHQSQAWQSPSKPQGTFAPAPEPSAPHCTSPSNKLFQLIHHLSRHPTPISHPSHEHKRLTEYHMIVSFATCSYIC